MKTPPLKERRNERPTRNSYSVTEPLSFTVSSNFIELLSVEKKKKKKKKKKGNAGQSHAEKSVTSFVNSRFVTGRKTVHWSSKQM